MPSSTTPSPYTPASTSPNTRRNSMYLAGAAATGLASNAAGLATSIKQLGQKPRPAIEVKLTDAQQDAFAPSYTSLDEINGEASIIAQTDLSFDDIYITFEGATQTFVEKVATTSHTNGKTQAFQIFLRLQQPVGSTSLPENKILRGGQTYTFPFLFVVPEALLPGSCKHPKGPNFPEGAHLSLPPSLGDPMVANVGNRLMDDMAPDMGCIKYSVKCRLTDGKGPSNKVRVLAEGSKKVRIVPAVTEAPPLSVEGGNIDDYKLRKEKSIRKGLFRQKLGSVIMQSVQPKSLRHPLGSEDDCAVTTMATVNLRFDPHDAECHPPKLQSLESKLKAATFFASQPLQELPTKSSDFHFSSVKGLFVETIPLSRRCVFNTEWQKHPASELSPQSYRDPGWSFSGTDLPAPSENFNEKLPHYTARVVVPISLPKCNKIFVPSFHSCLVSRVYALDLYLSVSTPNANVRDPTLHIKLPLQISQEGRLQVHRPMGAQEAAAINSQQANEFFNPRIVAPLAPGFTERSNILGSSSHSSPRAGQSAHSSNRNSTATDPSPFSSPTVQRDSIAEDCEWEAGSPRPLPSQGIPPSPGPGYSHRASLTHTGRLPGAQHRFESLSFENEEAAMAPPPEYAYGNLGGMYREREMSRPTPQQNVADTGVAEVRTAADWAALTGSRPR